MNGLDIAKTALDYIPLVGRGLRKLADMRRDEADQRLWLKLIRTPHGPTQLWIRTEPGSDEHKQLERLTAKWLLRRRRGGRDYTLA